MESPDWGKEMGEFHVLGITKKETQKDNVKRVLVKSSPSVDAWFNNLVGEVLMYLELITITKV